MAKTTRIKLLNVPEHLEPGDAIECVVNDAPGRSWHRTATMAVEVG